MSENNSNSSKHSTIKELFWYVVFGVLTTLVNWVVYFVLCHLLGSFIKNSSVLALVCNPPAWVCGVAFAFVTNKLWVFNSKSWAPSVIKREIPEFVGARAITGIMEEFGLPVILFIPLVKHFSWQLSLMGKDFNINNQMLAKVIIAVIVVILNYIFSKAIIFNKKHSESKNPVEEKQENTEA